MVNPTAGVYINSDVTVRQRLTEMVRDLDIGTRYGKGRVVSVLLEHAQARGYRLDPSFHGDRYLHIAVDEKWAGLRGDDLGSILSTVFREYIPTKTVYNGSASEVRIVQVPIKTVRQILKSALERQILISDAFTSAFDTSARSLLAEVGNLAPSGSVDITFRVPKQSAEIYDRLAVLCSEIGWNADTILASRLLPKRTTNP